MSFLAMHIRGTFVTALAIIIGAFISEDAATVTAASLAAASVLDVRLSFASAVAGLWVGDLGVYALARWSTQRMQRASWFSRAVISIQRDAAATSGDWPLALSRIFPGMRLPAYVACGLNRMPLARFAGITGFTAALWTAVVFAAIWIFPAQAQTAKERLALFGIAGMIAFAGLWLWKKYGTRLRTTAQRKWLRLVRWEFWPAWMFYAPVVAMCAWLGIRYQGISLPTIANLNQKNGGIIGESKMEILHELMKGTPERTARAFLVPAGSGEERFARIESIRDLHGLSYPLVLKPDTAQRGAGFRKVQSSEEIRNYLQVVREPLVLQTYVEGPNEAGVFYYRFPDAPEGEIFGITRKRFPTVTGDGIHSLEELIERDPRARILSGVYVRRFGAAAKSIPARGEKLRLVEAGNHCQGCIFEDGWDLYSEKLRRAIDEISCKIPGFYVGRFDLRYTTDEALRAGDGFQIIELNGAASEATNLYDAKNSLWSAYRTLYHQWKLIYAIGAENRKRGSVPRPVLSVWRDWRDFSARACEFPVAD
jgi:membrane protein DedA with SNARE-associated domain